MDAAHERVLEGARIFATDCDTTIVLCSRVTPPPPSPPLPSVAGFKRRDIELQRHIFSAHANVSSNGGSAAIRLDRLPQALAAAFARSPEPSCRRQLELAGGAVIDFTEFRRILIAPSALERWLMRLPLAKIISDAMPPDIGETELDGSGLMELAGLPPDIVSTSLQAALVGIAQVAPIFSVAYLPFVLLIHKKLCEILLVLTKFAGHFAGASRTAHVAAAATRHPSAFAFEISGNASMPTRALHFLNLCSLSSQVIKMSVGSISDFHRGLTDRIGAPNLDFETTMRLEHCVKSGSNHEFVASNYQVTTTPCKEWLYVLGKSDVRFSRFSAWSTLQFLAPYPD
jgi:hypothetical protein